MKNPFRGLRRASRIVAVIACLFATAINGQNVVEKKRRSMPPASANNSEKPQMEKSGIQSSILFLESIHKLAQLPSIDLESIQRELNWKVLREISADDKSYTHTFFDDSGYRVSTGQSFGTPFFTDGKVSNKKLLTIKLSSRQLCMTSNDVFSKFGDNFESDTFVMQERWPHANEMSVAVKKNRELFKFGPIYTFARDGVTTRVNFSFNFSECAESVSIDQRNPRGDKK